MCKNTLSQKMFVSEVSYTLFIFVVTMHSKDYTNSDCTLNVLLKPRILNY